MLSKLDRTASWTCTECQAKGEITLGPRRQPKNVVEELRQLHEKASPLCAAPKLGVYDGVTFTTVTFCSNSQGRTKLDQLEVMNEYPD